MAHKLQKAEGEKYFLKSYYRSPNVVVHGTSKK